MKVGDVVQAKVLILDEEKRKLSLGLKQVQPNPWANAAVKYKTGTRVTGIVSHLAPFGAFIKLEDGIEGLIHVSDLSWQEKISHPKQILKENDKVEEKLEMQKDGDALMQDIVAVMDKNPGSPEVQRLVQRHYDSLRRFYEPTLPMYRGLADMYVGYAGDKRFRAYFEKYHKDLPEFMREAIYAYCYRGEEK